MIIKTLITEGFIFTYFLKVILKFFHCELTRKTSKIHTQNVKNQSEKFTECRNCKKYIKFKYKKTLFKDCLNGL